MAQIDAKDKKISELERKAQVTGGELIPVADGNANYSITPSQITKKVEDAQEADSERITALENKLSDVDLKELQGSIPTIQRSVNGTDKNYIYSDPTQQGKGAIAAAKYAPKPNGRLAAHYKYWGDNDFNHNTEFPTATQTTDGVMSATDKLALDTLVDDVDTLEVTVDALDKGLGEVEQDLKTHYAKKDGAYEGMLVGTALNLEGQDTVANSSMYRTTGGTNDVASGLAELMAVRGESRVMNQLVKNGDFANGVEGWSLRQGPNALVSTKDGLTLKCIFDELYPISSHQPQVTTPVNLIDGHTYLIFGEYKVDETIKNIPTSSARFGFGIPSYTIHYPKNINNAGLGTKWTPFSYIVKKEEKEATVFSFLITAGGDDSSNDSFNNANAEWGLRKINVFDLTLIYGAGNEPAAAEEFEADYQRWFGKALSYEEYDEGSIRTVQATGVKTVGFNLYSGGDFEGSMTQWFALGEVVWKNDCNYEGAFDIDFDVVSDSDTNQSYFVLFFKDGSAEYINGIGNQHVHYKTGGGSRIVERIERSKHHEANVSLKNICINFSWSGKRDGDFEPHWEEVKALPITTLTSGGKVIFPDGLKRAGNVYDEIFVENGVTKAVKRVGVVDLGSLNWNTGYGGFTTSGVEKLIKRAPSQGNANLLSAIYSISDQQGRGFQKSIYQMRNPNNQDDELWYWIGIADSTYSTTADLKQSLQGVLLYYELAEPETYIVDDFELPMPYKVDDYGTEQVVSPEGSVAPVLMTRYGVNAVDTLRRLPQNYISAESIDALLAQMSAAMGGTWSKTWNEQKSAYDFTFFKNATINDSNLLEETTETT